jgi:subtilase family serine protease
MLTHTRFLLLPAIMGAAAMTGFAQPNQITSQVDNSRTVTLPGRVRPLATAANDVGATDSGFPLSLTMQLKISADQQSALDRLLQQQQNPASTSFHQWLTPEQYADRFGASPSDAGQIAAWLRLQGFTVDEVSRSRTFVMFHGTAGQVQSAFGTSIHRYRVNGELHYANVSDPKIPAALSGVVAGIRGLNDFRPKPPLHILPLMTTAGLHYLAPDDFATIYDIMPMYSAGINGSGQSIAIVDRSSITRVPTSPHSGKCSVSRHPSWCRSWSIPGRIRGLFRTS